MSVKRNLGDNINRGFYITVVTLSIIMIIRFVIAIAQHKQPQEYPETQDDFAETANGLGIPLELVDSTVNDAYVDGFFE